MHCDYLFVKSHAYFSEHESQSFWSVVGQTLHYSNMDMDVVFRGQLLIGFSLRSKSAREAFLESILRLAFLSPESSIQTQSPPSRGISDWLFRLKSPSVSS
jgi:hypothetical protein